MKKIFLRIIILLAILSSFCRCGMDKDCKEFNDTYLSDEFDIKIDSMWQDGTRRKWVFENIKEKKKFENGGVYELYHIAEKGDRIIKLKNSNEIKLISIDNNKDSVRLFKFECKNNLIYYNNKPMN